MPKIGIIGGSGIEDKLDLSDPDRLKIHTPYGAPSGLIITGSINGVEAVALARHGPGHSIMPSMVNYRANIWAFKEMGVTHILATTACGSLREEIKPGHLVFIDQFIDRTTRRIQTFYEGAQICHIPMAEPFCPGLRKLLAGSAERLSIPYHNGGVMVTIEGPRFSSKAESLMFRQWGGHVINMSTVPEVVLAREAGLCYASLAMCTDYDCWHEDEKPVSVQLILRTMQENSDTVNRMLPEVLPLIRDSGCACGKAASQSLI